MEDYSIQSNGRLGRLVLDAELASDGLGAASASSSRPNNAAMTGAGGKVPGEVSLLHSFS